MTSRSDGRIGDRSHDAHSAAAVDNLKPGLGQQPPEVDTKSQVPRIMSLKGTTEHAHTTHRHLPDNPFSKTAHYNGFRP